MIDDSGRCLEVNDALALMLGYSADELVGVTLADLIDPSERSEFSNALQQVFQGTRSKWATEQQWLTKHASGIWGQTTLSLIQSSAAAPRFISLFVQDITRRKQLEVELRHAQKLESVGRLAAGIAHEINTPIQFIGDNLQFLSDALDSGLRLRACHRELLARAVGNGTVQQSEIDAADSDADIVYLDREVPRALAQTRDGLERVTKIVSAMKDFAHPDCIEHSLADLNRALMSTITIARGELEHVAEVVTEFGDLPEISCDVGALNQAFLNIVVNAAHAIADVVGSSGQLGTIRIRTALDGDMVLISIADTGGGIPESIRNRVFEPFFTTKAVGRGTGQGLALAHAIVVERHAGSLTFQSRSGEGTTFEIRLPLNRVTKSGDSQQHGKAA